MRPFRISEQDLEPGCRELRVEGEVDLSVAGQLKSRLDAAATQDAEVFLHLDQCDFIDCTGIAAIVSAAELMARTGRRLRLCNPSAQVARLLVLTGLAEGNLVHYSAGTGPARRFGHAAQRRFQGDEPLQG